jgi:hypothetical protein
MGKRSITGSFATRREAEMVVETLVQEYNVDRSSIRVQAEGEDNTSGSIVSGTDVAERHRAGGGGGDVIRPEPEQEAHADGIRAGRITVSAEVEETVLQRAEVAFREYGARTAGSGG